ncbi:hypothetical protein ACFSJ3_03040 [Corallincola platygyrae]|uniref:Uncharacterized protein n=1 Tax=Corallincola platygyrae TaxID=1193278 RepID=A0ABW4XJY1_9GAMM
MGKHIMTSTRRCWAELRERRTVRFLAMLVAFVGVFAAEQAHASPAFTPTPLVPSNTVNEPTHKVTWTLSGKYTVKSLRFTVVIKPNNSNPSLICHLNEVLVADCSYSFGDTELGWRTTSTIYTQINMDYAGDYSLYWEALVYAPNGDETPINGVYTIRYELKPLEEMVEIDLPEEKLVIRLSEFGDNTYRIPLNIRAKTNSPALGGRLIINTQGIPCRVLDMTDGSEHECTGMTLPVITGDSPTHLDILLKNINQSHVSSNTPLEPIVTVKVDVPGGRQVEAAAKLFLKESLWLAVLFVAAGVFVTYGLRVLVVTVKPNLVFTRMVLDAAVWLEDSVRRMTSSGKLDAEQLKLLSFVRSHFDALARARVHKPDSINDQATLVSGLAENTVNWLRKYFEGSENSDLINALIKARDDFMSQMVDIQSVEQFKKDTNNAVTAVHMAASTGRAFSPESFKTSRIRVIIGLAVVSLVHYLVFFLVAGLSGYSLLWAGADTWGGTESYIKGFLWGMGISLSGSGVISFGDIEKQLRLKSN